MLASTTLPRVQNHLHFKHQHREMSGIISQLYIQAMIHLEFYKSQAVDSNKYGHVFRDYRVFCEFCEESKGAAIIHYEDIEINVRKAHKSLRLYLVKYIMTQLAYSNIFMHMNSRPDLLSINDLILKHGSTTVVKTVESFTFQSVETQAWFKKFHQHEQLLCQKGIEQLTSNAIE
jgi:hypothetical protein